MGAGTGVGAGVGQRSPSTLSQQPQSTDPHSISTTIPALHIDPNTTPLMVFPYNGIRARFDNDATLSGRPPVSRFSDSDSVVSLVSRPTSAGIVPVSELDCSSTRSSVTNSPISAGIGPTSMLEDKSSLRRADILLSSAGIDPARAFDPRTSWSSTVIVLSCDGILPPSPFEAMSKYVICDNAPTSVGMDPLNVLFSSFNRVS